MHRKRLIVAAVILPFLYLYIMYLPPLYFFFLVVFISIIALSEFYSMYHIAGALKYAGLFFGISLVGASYFSQNLLLDILFFSIMALIGTRLFSKKDPLSSLSDLSPPVLGLLYIPALLTFQVQIRELGPEWLILLYGSVWSADSLAYYAGTGIGKRKLYREVSPNKTVEGAAGSVIGGVVGALMLRFILIPQLTVSAVLFLGIMIGVVSIIGDLVESMFKRDAKVKDSGALVPGHGGILDKIDGILFSGPLFYWMLKVLNIM